MPNVKIELWKGCTKEQKAELAKEITESIVRIAGKKPQNIVIRFEDYEKENWAIGGTLACDMVFAPKA